MWTLSAQANTITHQSQCLCDQLHALIKLHFHLACLPIITIQIFRELLNNLLLLRRNNLLTKRRSLNESGAPFCFLWFKHSDLTSGQDSPRRRLECCDIIKWLTNGFGRVLSFVCHTSWHSLCGDVDHRVRPKLTAHSESHSSDSIPASHWTVSFRKLRES